ncbi:MAG: AtpZ/AtpI family protein [Hyphomicrobiales bacterium]|nr:AtpZ/AtpI family protein [Hyphomicrobiales bacterium]
MSGNDTEDDGSGTDRPADEVELSERLQRLDQQLSQRDEQAGGPDGEDPTAKMSAFGQAWRLSSELVAGVAVGAAMGWALDRWLDTSPWGMIVFLLLGFAAGVLNLLRATGSLR